MPPLEQHKASRDLPIVLDAAAVRDPYAEIEPFVSETTLLTLNAAAVECFGTQAVQLFVATARALDMNGGRLAIVNATPPFAKPMPTLAFSPTSTPGAQQMPRKMLTFDDSRTMWDVVSSPLKGARFEVLEAQGGLKALGVLATTRGDLIITDIDMPKSGDDRKAGSKAAGVAELTP